MVSQTQKEIIGIDPGAKGAAVLISENRRIEYIRFLGMHPLDRREIADWFFARSFDPTLIFMEKIHSRPTDGKASTHKFGRNTGFVDGILSAHHMDDSIEFVDPKIWQFAFRLGGLDPKKRKNAHKARAQELFPDIPMTLDLCDALLLAEYGWRKTYGGLHEERNRELRPGAGVVSVRPSLG